MRDDEFFFDPPVFVLAERDDFGGPPGDRSIRFLSRSVGQQQMPLVFTDEGLAAEFLDSISAAHNLVAVKFPTLIDFRQFLLKVMVTHSHVVFDMNPKTQIGRMLPTKPLLDQIERQ